MFHESTIHPQIEVSEICGSKSASIVTWNIYIAIMGQTTLFEYVNN